MNAKKILGLVMALIMVVTACAPSVFATQKAETNHEHLDILENPELVEKYEEIKAVVEAVAKDIEENHEEYYAQGYAYALNNGYIDGAKDVINTALEVLPQVDLDSVEMTDEIREKLEVEIDALIPTLEELLVVLERDDIDNFDGFVSAIVILEDDLYTHLNNIYAILEQASIDLNNLVIIPALEEALEFINEVVIPELQVAVDAFVDAVVDYVQAKLEALYNEALGVTEEIYNHIIETLVRFQLYVAEKIENALAPIVNAYLEVVETLTEICGSVEEAVLMATQIINNVIDAIEYLDYLNNQLENAIVETIENAAKAYIELVKTIYETYGSLEEALKAANAILMEIVETVDGAIADAIALYNAILNAVVRVYGEVENVVIVAGQIFSYVYDFAAENLTEEKLVGVYNGIVDIVLEAYGTVQDAHYVATQIYAYLMNAMDHTFEGNYMINADSLYVSLGDAVYGKDLADMLHLGNKYHNFALNENYLDKVDEADLITIRFDNGEALTFVMSRFDNLDEELDWSKYLDAEGQRLLAESLAGIREALVASGQASEVAVLIEEAFNVPAVGLTDEAIAMVVSHVIEGTLYAYAEFVDRFTTVIENVYEAAPEATIVITGIQNPLNNIDLSDLDLGFDFEYVTTAFDCVVAGLNVQLVAAALTNDNAVFVNSVDAQDIYDALNVVCGHMYDDCLDVDCNVCGETRKAPGHSFTHYETIEEATCQHPAKEKSVCDNCGATTTREVGKALDHQFGEWTVIKEATTDATGLQERVCSVCNYRETETIPMLPPAPAKTSPWAILIVVGVVVLYIVLTKKKDTKSEDKDGKDNKKDNKKDDKKNDKKDNKKDNKKSAPAKKNGKNSKKKSKK